MPTVFPRLPRHCRYIKYITHWPSSGAPASPFRQEHPHLQQYHFCVHSHPNVSASHPPMSPPNSLSLLSPLLLLRWPSRWNIRTRRAHKCFPMWCIHNGRLYKLTHTPPKSSTSVPQPRHDWDGPAYKDFLRDGTEISVVQRDPYRWELKNIRWREFMQGALLGPQGYQRGALAFRMASSVPLPAFVQCGSAEYWAARSEIGGEVSDVWGKELFDLVGMDAFSSQDQQEWQECILREDLAVALHVKMLTDQPEKCGTGSDWTRYAVEWLQGEMIMWDKPLSGADLWPGLLQHVLAHGPVRMRDGTTTGYWHRVRKTAVAGILSSLDGTRGGCATVQA